jgi:hypothetical protein
MAKGGKRTGAGRPEGSTNKATQAAREAIALFVDNNVGRLQDWLDAIAQENPEKAFNLFQSVIEYHVPKLGRTEHTGKDGGAIDHNVNVKYD